MLCSARILQGMLRAALLVALCSIGCAAETTTAEADGELLCGWGALALAGMDESGCVWSIRSLDTSIARLRSLGGSPSEPVPLCEIETFARIDWLQPGDVVEVWMPADIDPETTRDVLEIVCD